MISINKFDNTDSINVLNSSVNNNQHHVSKSKSLEEVAQNISSSKVDKQIQRSKISPSGENKGPKLDKELAFRNVKAAAKGKINSIKKFISGKTESKKKSSDSTNKALSNEKTDQSQWVSKKPTGNLRGNIEVRWKAAQIPTAIRDENPLKPLEFTRGKITPEQRDSTQKTSENQSSLLHTAAKAAVVSSTVLAAVIVSPTLVSAAVGLAVGSALNNSGEIVESTKNVLASTGNAIASGWNTGWSWFQGTKMNEVYEKVSEASNEVFEKVSFSEEPAAEKHTSVEIVKSENQEVKEKEGDVSKVEAASVRPMKPAKDRMMETFYTFWLNDTTYQGTNETVNLCETWKKIMSNTTITNWEPVKGTNNQFKISLDKEVSGSPMIATKFKIAKEFTVTLSDSKEISFSKKAIVLNMGIGFLSKDFGLDKISTWTDENKEVVFRVAAGGMEQDFTIDEVDQHLANVKWNT